MITDRIGLHSVLLPLQIHTGCVDFTIKMMFSLLYTFGLHFYSLIFIFSIIRTLDYPDYLPRSRRVRIIEVRLYPHFQDRIELLPLIACFCIEIDVMRFH